jgi:predicted DNA-binding protein with PD1-like motif
MCRGGRAAICTVKPNEDIGQAIEAVCRRNGFDDASIQGIGSLVGVDFDKRLGRLVLRDRSSRHGRRRPL